MLLLTEVFLPILEISLVGCLLVAAFGCAAGVVALDHYVDGQISERLTLRSPEGREWHAERTWAGLEDDWDQQFAYQQGLPAPARPRDELIPQPLREVVARTSDDSLQNYDREGEML